VFTLSTLIITAIVVALLGAVAGAGIARSMRPQAQDLETRLQSAEEQLKVYQQEVSEHFLETSRLVNQLTQSYKEVHEHLADSALKLSNPEISRQLMEAGQGNLLESSPRTYTDADPAEAPKDWAPRQPGDAGQLSEGYGLTDDRDK
jgi:uncharacterized protein